MHLKKLLSLVKLLPLLPVAVKSYKWPSPQYDTLEETLYEGESLSRDAVAEIASGCASRISSTGPPFAAEWLRLAYHDMATHNITEGTGGLDASIYYEYDRPENVGAGNLNSLNDFGPVPNKYVSRADVIAMGAVWGIAGCGGPTLTFRGGRIDATEAGRFGVPLPQEDLQTHTEKFRLQGFTPTEMISLVACGHTVGGVRGEDFPNIVPDPDPSSNATVVQSFDDTIRAYDPDVVAQYLNGTTQDPLVTVSNATLQSDLRIFSSDNNVTMKSMNSPTAFSGTCAPLLERMLNTVPSNVQLTEEIVFLPFKVRRAQILVTNSQLMFHVEARVVFPPNVAQNVTLFWCDKRGAAASCADGQANFAIPAPQSVGSTFLSSLSTALNLDPTTVKFDVPLGSGSVQKFWFEVGNSTLGGPVVVEDNGGDGYILEQDTLIALTPVLLTSFFTPGVIGITNLLSVVAGVLDGTATALPQALLFDRSVPFQTGVPTIPPPLNVTYNLSLNSSIPAVAGYTFYSAQINATASASLDYSVAVDGQQYAVDLVSAAVSSFVFPVHLSSVGKTALHNN